MFVQLGLRKTGLLSTLVTGYLSAMSLWGVCRGFQ